MSSQTENAQRENALSEPAEEPKRETFHSKDFPVLIPGDGINGRTQEEWESEWGVTGMIEHLSEIGWDRYQWRHASKDLQEKRAATTCFAEFFSEHYNGYLRGDGETVEEAVRSCLNEAQGFLACEHSEEGHVYENFRNYTNGLARCTKCGFNGYASDFKRYKHEIRELRMRLDIAQTNHAQVSRALEEAGLFVSMDGIIRRRTEDGRPEEFFVPAHVEAEQSYQERRMAWRAAEKKRQEAKEAVQAEALRQREVAARNLFPDPEPATEKGRRAKAALIEESLGIDVPPTAGLEEVEKGDLTLEGIAAISAYAEDLYNIHSGSESPGEEVMDGWMLHYKEVRDRGETALTFWAYVGVTTLFGARVASKEAPPTDYEARR